ncbi:hypothetical protein BD309DRAFT_131822 [Dichomitus squalens]|nr:hypothetical protein BD309DRAFT_131822 [Dichomitus squalens]
MPTMALPVLDLVAATLNSSNGSATTIFDHPPPPVLLGGFVALYLSGAVFMQVVVYFQIYQAEAWTTKSIVLVLWVLDILHSAMICIANWQNLVVDYGAYNTLDNITWSIPVTIALTALTTAIIHCFFIRRIFKLSRGNWFITLPLLLLALLRVVTTAEMLRLRSYVLFIQDFAYIFTLGLAVSAALDILITSILCYYLRRGREGFAPINHMIDLLILYTVENGMITCIATALSLFFWLFMRSNFAFLGMHFVINKLYANSIMASLNARKSIVGKVSGSERGYQLPMILPHHPQSPRSTDHFSRGQIQSTSKPLQVTIDVERTVQRDGTIDADSKSTSGVDLRLSHKPINDNFSDIRRQ